MNTSRRLLLGLDDKTVADVFDKPRRREAALHKRSGQRQVVVFVHHGMAPYVRFGVTNRIAARPLSVRSSPESKHRDTAKLDPQAIPSA
jgi:hypothetical protein